MNLLILWACDGNGAPGAPEVAVSEGADGSLSCVVTREATDPDGDALTTRFTFAVDGAAWGEGAEVPAEEAARGRTWTCVARASDGAVEGLPGVASLTVGGPVASQYAFEKVLDLPVPADVVALPDGRLLVATMLGTVALVDPEAGEVSGEQTVREPDDLIAIALDGDRLYAWLNKSCELLRWDVSLEPFALSGEQSLLSVDCPEEGGHSGGDLLFWSGETAERTLYLSTGPTVGSNPQGERDLGQKLLALHVDDAAGAVTAAVSGPFEDDRVVALGLRNPWRIADCGAAICIADPGSIYYEEVNLYRGAGMNFGFPGQEGPGDGEWDEPAVWWNDDEETFAEADLDGPADLGFVNAPVIGVRASSAGYGGRLDGWLLYGEIYDGWIRAMEVDEAGAFTGGDVPIAHLPYVLSMTEAPDGTIYAVEMGGSVRRLVFRADRPRVGEPGEALSGTAFSDGGLAYTVRHPQWANGAEPTWTLQIPDDALVETGHEEEHEEEEEEEEGHHHAEWHFPDGTRVWQTLSWAGEPVETRLLEKRDDAWIAGVWVWDGADAYLTDGTRQELTLGDGTPWIVPSQASCEECHDAERGGEWPIGLEPFQLGEEGLAVVAPALDDEVEAPEDPGMDALDTEVRGYLHGNCAYCHCEEAVVYAVSVVRLDFNWETEESGLIGEIAAYWHANPNTNSGDPLVVPGSAEESVLVRMLEATDMPNVGIWTPDEAGIASISAWIDRM